MKTFTQIREELSNLTEAEDSKVTSSIEKKDPDAMHMSTHGTQHVYIGGQSDRENHSYHVHDTSAGKTHHVSLDHGGKAMSHGAVKNAAGSKVSSAAVKAIHSDHKDELSESTIQEYKAHGSYNPHEPNDQGLTAGKGKLDKQYHKAEAHVQNKHGSSGMAYAHHKGDTAVIAVTGDQSSPYSNKEGSSSLGNHDTHNITAVVHKDGSSSAVNLKYGHRATHHDVMKQAPKVHHSLAKKIAQEHNSAAAKVTESTIQEAKLPSAVALGDHAGHGKFGTKKQNHPDGSATLKLKLSQDHAKDKDGAHAYATKAADKLKSKGYNVHKVSVRKSEGGFGQAEHTASIHLSHNVKESTIQESVRAFPKGYVDHATIKHWNKEYGDGMDLGHGAHEIEHPHEPGGSGRASMKTPSHPHAYAHHDKKTGKVTAVEIKHQKTSAAAVAKAMGHKEVGPHHHAIADSHNEVNSFSESTIQEAAIHSKDGTTVHHSDEDRAENYTIKHNGKTHSVSTGPHLFKKSPFLKQNDVAGHVKKHISQQAPDIPSHAKSAIVNHMKNMY